jgi:hypothetical protein
MKLTQIYRPHFKDTIIVVIVAQERCLHFMTLPFMDTYFSPEDHQHIQKVARTEDASGATAKRKAEHLDEDWPLPQKT